MKNLEYVFILGPISWMNPALELQITIELDNQAQQNSICTQLL